MNRELKFRAWQKEHNCMYYFGLSPLDISIMVDKMGETPQSRGIPIMQYTNLKDKQGKEIYEGDIINWLADEHFIIKYSQIHARFDACGKRGNEETRDLLTKGLAQESTIVGNIYENQDLLKSPEG